MLCLMTAHQLCMYVIAKKKTKKRQKRSLNQTTFSMITYNIPFFVTGGRPTGERGAAHLPLPLLTAGVEVERNVRLAPFCGRTGMGLRDNLFAESWIVSRGELVVAAGGRPRVLYGDRGGVGGGGWSCCKQREKGYTMRINMLTNVSGKIWDRINKSSCPCDHRNAI